MLRAIESGRYEFPCGFESRMKEEGLAIPMRYIGADWEEDPEWIIKVKEHVPNMSDELLLDVWERFLCLEYR